MLLTAALAGCVGPSRTADDFASKAGNTAELVRSSVETARLGLDAASRGRATLPYLSRLFGDVEEDAGAAEQAFTAVQPPDAESDALRAELLELVDGAITALADVRTAIRREDVDAALSHGPELARLGDDLAAFIDDHG